MISTWKSNGLSDKIIKLPATSNYSLIPGLSYIGKKVRVNFEDHCLKQDKITFTCRKTVDIYIAYEINLLDCGYNDYPTLENFLFGTVRNSDIDNNKYSGYGIGFGRRGVFSVANGSDRRNGLFCACWYQEKKLFLILGEDPTKGKGNTTLNAEK